MMTLVLCQYEYLGQEGDSTEWYWSGVVVNVHRLDQIEPAFESVMKARQRAWQCGDGPKPLKWVMRDFVPETGRMMQ